MPRIYADAEKAGVYLSLTQSGGNIKRASRETGVPEATIRGWRDRWETDGVPDEFKETIHELAEDSLARMERVRDKALSLIEANLHEHKPRELSVLFGILDDKIRLTRGLATSRVENQSALPPADQMKEMFKAMIQGAVEAQKDRDQDIVDAEVVDEQAVPALTEGN